MRALTIYEAINFTREGTPLERLDIGRRSKILKAFKVLNLGNNEPMVEEATKKWMEDNPSLAKALEYNSNDPDDWKNIWGIELDYYCEEYDVDMEELENEFKNSRGNFKPSDPQNGELRYKIGTIGENKNGSKILYYQGGMVSGYVARKEWLDL